MTSGLLGEVGVRRRRWWVAILMMAVVASTCSDDDVGGGATSVAPIAAVATSRPNGDAALLLPESVPRPPVLFSADGPFNRPIPDDPVLAPGSDRMVRGIVDQVNLQGISLAIRESAIAVYEVDTTTPRYDIPLSIGWASASVLRGVPIPSYARADANNDHEIAFFDRATRCEWDFWQFRRVGESWVASWGNATRLDGDGIYHDGGAARAGGSALLAGLIWPDELASGHIDHALVFSYGLTKAGGPVAPAVGSDGWSSDPGAIPEGALVQLDPAFDVDSLQYEFEKTIARAMQEYGMYLMDSTSYGISLYAVNPIGFTDEPYEALIPPAAWEDNLWAVLDIPPEAFRVLAYGPENLDPPTDAVAAPGCADLVGGWRRGVWQTAVSDSTLYVAAGDRGLRIVDVSNPARPVEVAAWDAYANDLEPVISVTVRNGIVYVGTDGSGLASLDVSDPTTPRPLDRYGADEEFGIVSMAIDGATLYAVGGDSLHVLGLEAGRMRPVTLFVDEEVVSNGRDVAVAGSSLYLSDQWYEMVSIGIGDPSRPRALGSYEAEASGLVQTYGEGVAAAGDIVYYTDEDGGLAVLDVSDASNPVLIGSVDLEDFAYGLDVGGGLVYVANGASGLQVIDTTDPTRPVRLSAVPIDGYARDVVVDGSMAYVAAGDGGVAMVDVSDPLNPVVVATYTP